jgi:hypothetical protein
VKEMNRFSRFSLLVALVFISGITPVKLATAQDANTLHWTAWDNALAAIETDPAQRYAYYAYRTLAVPHPEVYLQADALFSSIIEQMPGSRAAFKGADVRNLELFHRLLEGKQEGPSFNWRMWVPTSDSIYDASHLASGLSWLDRRVASAAVLLTAQSPQMSTAEAAMMRYTQMRRGGESDSALFIVIDADGHGYLAQDGLLLSVQTGRDWAGDSAGIIPALVFNERFVFYPLYARDDRTKSAALARVAGMFAVPSCPVLSAEDSMRTARLARAAALPTPESKQLALLSAIGGIGLEQETIGHEWEELLGHEKYAEQSELQHDSAHHDHDHFGQSKHTGIEPLGCEKGMLRSVCYRANRLSPHTALLASLVPDVPFDSAAILWEKQYLAWCGRRVNPRDTVKQEYEAGGYLWAFELLEITFDDIIRTRAGAGSSQALAMAAALDLLEIPNMRVEIDPGDEKQPSQHWVLADGGRWQFNYGSWRRVGGQTGTASRRPMLINSYGVEDRWAHLIIPSLYTDAEPLTVSEDLTRLAVMMPSVAPVLRSGVQNIMRFAEFMRQMGEDRVEWRPLPWPVIEGGAMRGAVDSR